MQPYGLFVRLADIDYGGEIAVLPVLQILRSPGRPLNDGHNVAVLQLQLLHPASSGGLDPFEGLVFIVHHQVNAALGDLGFHRPEALLVHIELALGADDVAQGEDGDGLRGSRELHAAALQNKKVLHLLVSSFMLAPLPVITPLVRPTTGPGPLPRNFTLLGVGGVVWASVRLFGGSLLLPGLVCFHQLLRVALQVGLKAHLCRVGAEVRVGRDCRV